RKRHQLHGMLVTADGGLVCRTHLVEVGDVHELGEVVDRGRGRKMLAGRQAAPFREGLLAELFMSGGRPRPHGAPLRPVLKLVHDPLEVAGRNAVGGEARSPVVARGGHQLIHFSSCETQVPMPGDRRTACSPQFLSVKKMLPRASARTSSDCVTSAVLGSRPRRSTGSSGRYHATSRGRYGSRMSKTRRPALNHVIIAMSAERNRSAACGWCWLCGPNRPPRRLKFGYAAPGPGAGTGSMEMSRGLASSAMSTRPAKLYGSSWSSAIASVVTTTSPRSGSGTAVCIAIMLDSAGPNSSWETSFGAARSEMSRMTRPAAPYPR